MNQTSSQRLYYSIKEVAELFDEEQHILRYWEREFECLRPTKNRAGNRTYAEKDLRVLRVIKKLLRVDRIPVSEARVVLRKGVDDEMVAEAMRAYPLSIDHTHKNRADVAEAQTNRNSIPTVATPSSPFVSTKSPTYSSPSISIADMQELLTALKDVVADLEQLSRS